TAPAYVFAGYSTQIVGLPEAAEPLPRVTFPLPLLGDIVPFNDLGVKGLATVVILLLTVVNYVGVRFGGVVQNIFSVAKMSAMLGLAAAVLVMPGVGQFTNLTADS